MTQSERALQEIQAAVASTRAAQQVIEPSVGEGLMREVAKSVDALHDHILNQITNLRHTLDIIERAIGAKRKAHEDQLREYVAFADKAMDAIVEVDREVRQMGAIVMEMPVTKPNPEPERPTLIGQ